MTEEAMKQSLITQSQNETGLPQSNFSPLQKILDNVNGQGKFQRLSFCIFNVLWFATSWLLLGLSFFFDDQYTCDPALQFTTRKQCEEYVCAAAPADRYLKMESYPKSIVFQFDNFLICDDYGYVVTILQSMLFCGSLVGFFVIPYIADNWGRKLAIRASWAIGTLGVLVCALADSPNMVGLGYFFAGFGSNPAITLCFSFINEQCLGKSRQMFGVGVQIALAIGESTIALVFLTGWGWRNIFYILLIIFAATNGLLFYLEESPFFLLKKNKQLALQSLNRIAKINNRPSIKNEEIQHIQVKEEQSKSSTVIDLFRYKSVRWMSISSGLIFLGIQTIYYSTSLNLDAAGFNKYINQEIIGISEMLGYISAEFIISKCNRKKATFIGLGISSVMCLALAVLLMVENDSNENIIKLLQTIGLIINRLVLCGFWSIFYVYVAQLFPTSVRSLGYGWTSITGMIGSISSPYIILLCSSLNINSWIPPGIIGIVAWFFIFPLPQTFGLPLKAEIEERESVIDEKDDSEDSTEEV